MNASQHVEELIEMYALGALTVEEHAGVKPHLATCARCQELAAGASATTTRLAFAVDDLTPALAVKARLMARVDADLVATVPMRAAKPARAEKRASSSLVRWGAAWGAIRQAFGTWSPAIALAGLVLLMITGAYALSLRNQVLETQAKLALLGDPQFRTAVLATTPATPPGAQAHLLLSPDRSSALLTLNGVKPLAASQTYEFWLIQDGKPLPAGTFRVDPSGNAQFLVHASQPLRDFQQAGITIERAGGSQTPTVSAMIFAGPIHE